MPEDRVHAAGPRQKPVFHAHGRGKPPVLRAPLRTQRRGAPPQDRPSDQEHGPLSLPRPSGGQALRRHEAEARPLLFPDPRSRPARARRTDHRRRSARTPPVLGPGRLHPRGPGKYERDRGDRVHGRGTAVRLADRHERRQDPRHRHARRNPEEDRQGQPRRRVHRAAAGGTARRPQGPGRTSARDQRGRRLLHRGRGPDQAVRHVHRRRPRQFPHPQRRDFRLPRLQRLRQDHHHAHADRAPARHRGRRQTLRQPHRRQFARDPQAPRLHDAALLSLRRPDRAPEPRALRPPVPDPRRRDPRTRRRPAQSVPAEGDRTEAPERPPARPEAAPLPRRRGHPQSRDRDPRRTDLRRRPRRPRPLLGAHH